jgi:hypothetical protein
MKNLVKVKEVKTIDQFQAVMTFLESMGIEVSELTIEEVAEIKSNLLKSISI